MQAENQQINSGDITLRDVRNYFMRNGKLIVIGGFVGLAFSAAYLGVLPKTYEARWQMKVAQFVNTNTNTTYANSEEPAALIQRLRMPTAYTVDAKQNCGVQADGGFKEYLDGILTVDVVKNVPNFVEMNVRVSSPGQAKQCAEAIAEMVVAQQNDLIEERLAGRQEQLLQYQQAMREEQQQMEKIGKSELGNLGLLARLDKLGWLRGRIATLQEEILLSRKQPAKVAAPIYVSGKPVPPRVGLLLLGVSLGFMLGALYALGREGWRKAA